MLASLAATREPHVSTCRIAGGRARAAGITMSALARATASHRPSWQRSSTLAHRRSHPRLPVGSRLHRSVRSLPEVHLYATPARSTDPYMRTRFRETMWFKKGQLEVTEAAQPAEQEDELRPTAVDTMPVEDRYLDDGSVTTEDSALFSLRTGCTQHVPRIDCDSGRAGADGVEHLVRDIKRGRGAKLAM